MAVLDKSHNFSNISTSFNDKYSKYSEKSETKVGYLKQSGDLRVAPLPSYLLNVPSGYNFLCVSDLTYQAIFEDCHYL